MFTFNTTHRFERNLVSAVCLCEVISIFVAIDFLATIVDALQCNLGIKFKQDHHVRHPDTVQTQRACGSMQPATGAQIRHAFGGFLW